MIELRPVRIILISFYCFLVGLFFLSVAANTIFSNNGASDMVLWLPVAAAIILTAVLVTVGIGILYYNQLCWKMLFFFLVIFIANIILILLSSVFFLLRDQTLFYKYYQDMHITPIAWFSFSIIFLFGIVVLYLLTRKETVSYFGKMDELAQPF